jgi:hypothetical protein
VVDDAVPACHLAEHLLVFAGRAGAVHARRDQDQYLIAPHTCVLDLGEQFGEERRIGNRARDVRDNDNDLPWAAGPQYVSQSGRPTRVPDSRKDDLRGRRGGRREVR